MNKTGKIYKLYNQYGVYYGSTTTSLNRRLSQHKSAAKTRNCTSKILFQDSSIPKIELLEEVEFDDIKQLRDREAYYIRNLECINKDIPNRTGKEWKKDNKEYHKKWQRENKEKIKEYMKEYMKKYYEDNKEQLKNKSKENMKKYYETNKEQIKNKRKKYYEDNKNKKKEYQKEYRERKKQEAKQDKEVYEFLTEIENSNI